MRSSPDRYRGKPSVEDIRQVPATVRHLGEDLFTRIKDEEARELIRAFIAQAE